MYIYSFLAFLGITFIVVVDRNDLCNGVITPTCKNGPFTITVIGDRYERLFLIYWRQTTIDDRIIRQIERMLFQRKMSFADFQVKLTKLATQFVENATLAELVEQPKI
jgi:hypothetical protein